MTYHRKNHTKFLIVYHLIFVVKYRKPLLRQYGPQTKAIFHAIADRSAFAIQEMEVDRDHVHLLVNSSPQLSPAQFCLTAEAREYSGAVARLPGVTPGVLDKTDVLE
ncbi:MAG: IS200/IS605 family transposase [Candidatus Heimdallarchaeota archaeon]